MAIDLSKVGTQTAPRKPMRGSPTGRLNDDLRRDGYVCATPAEWGAGLISTSLADWAAFADSWGRLDLDPWMGDGHRRFAALSIEVGSIRRKPHQPLDRSRLHIDQSRLHNRLNGGDARWFSPVEREVAANTVTTALLRIGEALAGALVGWIEHAWHVEMHQFRMVADGTEPRHPTPEGLHRDGVSAVLMVLAGRRLRHCVSPVIAAAGDRPAWRDALVLTFRPTKAYLSFTLKETCHG